MPNTPAEYAQELERILGDLDNVFAASETEMLEILDTARATIQSRLAELDFDSPSRALLERARAGLDEALANMNSRLTAVTDDALEQAFQAGARIATAPLGPEFAVTAASVTTDQLAIVSRFSADLIQSVTDETRRRINGEIASVVVGGKTPQEAATAIGRNLTDPNHFRTVSHRARAIVVTETGRAQSLGTQAAQQRLAADQAAAGGPTPLKRWLNAHLPGARATHLSAEARYAPGGEVGPIPIDERFTINGTPALYPRDPNLPASESVNCHCVVVTVFDEQPAVVPGEEAPGTFTREQLDALEELATGRFDPEQVDRAREILASTDEGKDLFEFLDKWQNAETSGRFRSQLEKHLAGDLDGPAAGRAQAVLDAMRQAAVTDTPLHRGMAVRGTLENTLKKYVEGDTIDLNLSSFSSDRSVATRYATGRARETKANTTKIVIEWAGTKQGALPIQNLARSTHHFKQKEWVGGGRFRIVEVKKASGGINIKIEQEAPLHT